MELTKEEKSIELFNNFLNNAHKTQGKEYLKFDIPKEADSAIFPGDINPVNIKSNLLKIHPKVLCFDKKLCSTEEQKNKGINQDHFVLNIGSKKFHIKNETLGYANIEMMYVNELLLEMKKEGYDTFGIQPLTFIDKNREEKSAMTTAKVGQKRIVITEHQKDYKGEENIELFTKINQVAYFFMPVTGDLKADNVIVNKNGNITPIDVAGSNVNLRILYSDHHEENLHISQEAAKRSVLMMKNLPENFIENFNKKFYQKYNITNQDFMKPFNKMEDKELWIAGIKKRINDANNEYEMRIEKLQKRLNKKEGNEFNAMNTLEEGPNINEKIEKIADRQRFSVANEVVKRTDEFMDLFAGKEEIKIIHAFDEKDKKEKELYIKNHKFDKSYTVIINRKMANNERVSLNERIKTEEDEIHRKNMWLKTRLEEKPMKIESLDSKGIKRESESKPKEKSSSVFSKVSGLFSRTKTETKEKTAPKEEIKKEEDVGLLNRIVKKQGPTKNLRDNFLKKGVRK